MIPRASLFALTFALGACAARPSRPSAGGAERTSNGPPSPSSEDAGGPRACVRDVREKTELAPCVEDCDRGIAYACAEVASRLERGDGVARDLTRTVAMHERACELRDAASCVAAARMHAAGAGVPPSRARQVALLASACVLGDAFACALPAKAFASGAGVARDVRRAKELFERACAGGVEAACETLEDAGVGVGVDHGTSPKSPAE